MNIRKVLLKISILNYLHIFLSFLLIICSIFLVKINLYFEKKLSSLYLLIFEQLINFAFFLLYQIMIIIFLRIDFGKLESQRIESLINLNRTREKNKYIGESNFPTPLEKSKKIDDSLKIRYSNLAKLRTFCFYSPTYFTFVYFPLILSLIYPLYKIIYSVYEILKVGSVLMVRPNLLILIGINFLTNINSTLIYLYFGSKRSFIFLISLIINILYGFIIIYFSSIPSFNAIYTFVFAFNLMFTVILFFISINQNIRSNIYVE